MINPPVFTDHADGRVTVDDWGSEQVWITPEFLRCAHPAFVKREGFRRFSIVVANGRATYSLKAKNHKRNVFVAQKIKSMLIRKIEANA